MPKPRTTLIIAVVLIVVATVGLAIGTKLGRRNPDQVTAAPPPPAASVAVPGLATAAPTPEGGCRVTPDATGGILTHAPVTRWTATGPAQLPTTSSGPLTTVDGIPQCFTPDASGALTAAAYSLLYKGAPFDRATRVKAMQTYTRGEGQGVAVEAVEKNEPVGAFTIVGFRMVEPIQNNSVHLYLYVRDVTNKPDEMYTLASRQVWTGQTWVSETPTLDLAAFDTSTEGVPWSAQR